MAEIFKAKLLGVEGFEKIVVIKRILPFWSERREFITMLVDEAKVLVHLNHPNIVQIYELGRVGEIYFIAMEYVEGADLRRLTNKLQQKQKFLPQDMAVSIMIEALLGLHYAHNRALPGQGNLGVVHRDVSPQNILLSTEGEVKVTDFGIAKAVTQTHETQTGVLKGKYAYMSPEQALGKYLDGRSDIFSCGVVLYELLFHRRMFNGRSDIEILDQVRKVDVQWPEEVLKSFYPGIEAALRKSLALEPEQRFADSRAFADALEAALPGGRRVSAVQIGKFFKELFAEEIVMRKAPSPERTQTLAQPERKTLVASPNLEETIPLDATPSITHSMIQKMPETVAIDMNAYDLDATSALPVDFPSMPALRSPSRSVQAQPAAPGFAKPSFWMVMFLIASALGIYYWWSNHQRPVEPKPIARDIPNIPSLPAAPESRILMTWQGLSLLLHLPEGLAHPAWLGVERVAQMLRNSYAVVHLSIEPASAEIKASYPGGEKRAQGQLELRGIPELATLKVSASLDGYENYQENLKINYQGSKLEKHISLEKKMPKFGFISINAEPWGRIVMPSVAAGRTTPVLNVRIPVGSYNVKVVHPDLNQSFFRSVTIRDGKRTMCHADFSGKGSSYCR